MKKENNQKRTPENLCSSGKKPYLAPEVKPQAHLRDITLTVSGGIGESTGGGTHYNPVSGRNTDKSSGGSSSDAGIFENDIFE